MFLPENEMGVIVLFAQDCGDYGWIIKSIHSAYPDAIIFNQETGENLRVEFEFRLSNFFEHGHDPAGCDLVVCWDANVKDFPVKVLDISEWYIGPSLRKRIGLHLDIRPTRLYGDPGKYEDFAQAMQSNGTHEWTGDAIAQEFGVSRRTGNYWLARWKEEHPEKVISPN